MKLQAVKLYEYNASFKHAIVTPKIKLSCRKVLIIELITNTGQHYFGECNAFETDWYSPETIELCATKLRNGLNNIRMKRLIILERHKQH